MSAFEYLFNPRAIAVIGASPEPAARHSTGVSALGSPMKVP